MNCGASGCLKKLVGQVCHIIGTCHRPRWLCDKHSNNVVQQAETRDKSIFVANMRFYFVYESHCTVTVKPGFHIVVMIVSIVSNMFPILFQAILIHVNTLITTLQASPAW